MDKIQNPVILIIIHHRLNMLEVKEVIYKPMCSNGCILDSFMGIINYEVISLLDLTIGLDLLQLAMIPMAEVE
jgi:hypothetical protein